MTGVWENPENVRTLIEMVRDGASAEQINAALTPQPGTQAVRGKVFRLGLSLANSEKRRYTITKPPAKRVRVFTPDQKAVAAARRRAIRDAAKPAPPPPPAPPPIGGVSIFALKSNTCRAPLNNPPRGRMDETRFCGGEVGRGVYCLEHAAVCYQVPQPRRVRA